MLIKYDKLRKTWGTWVRCHDPAECKGRLCDIHNRRGDGPQSEWPLNWRQDRGILEVLCPHGVGHPTPAQVESDPDTATHGCDGCCTEENGW